MKKNNLLKIIFLLILIVGTVLIILQQRKSRRSCGKHCVRSTPKPGKKPKSAMSLLTATPLNKIF